jgi:ribosomal protein S18 acetylase RimI-like enzyme
VVLIVRGPEFEVRPAQPEDAREMAELLAAVAEERDGIATEPPVDVDARVQQFAATAGCSLVAVFSGAIIGMIHVGEGRFGVGELAMLVEHEWRGRGVGSALLSAAIDRARSARLHKLSLDVFPHNAAAIALYRKYGFVEEGRRVEHYRRANGELWDSIVMGLLL